MNDNKLAGHAASAAAYTIFGLNIVFCKDIANSELISPEALFGVRMMAAAAIFWLLSLFCKRERVPKKDIGLIFLASAIGLVIPQYTFLKGITMASSIEASIISALGPVFTMIFAAIFLREPITGRKLGGIVLSFAGILLLILSSIALSTGGNQGGSIAGILILLFNAVSFALYLGAFRNLIRRYSVITYMKWMFLFAFLISLPVSSGRIFSTPWNLVDSGVMAEVAYLIIFATVIAYFLMPIAQQNLRPTIVSMYAYLQPTIAVIVSIVGGIDSMTWQKAVAIILVIAGVTLVNRSRAAVH